MSTFRVKVPNISQRIESNKFSLNIRAWSIPWEIQIWKVATGTSESFAVKLLCLNKSDKDWSYTTSVTYRLYSFDDKVKAFEYEMRPKVVNDVDDFIFTNAFIKWSDLMDTEKVYVKNDTIKLEFAIKVADPNLLDNRVWREIQSHFLTKFEVSIKNAKNLLAVQSPNISILNERYCFLVYKYEEHLDVELCQMNDVKSCNRPMMLVKVISKKRDDRPVVQHFQFHTTKLISWEELHKPENGFIYDDDTVELEVNLITDPVFQEAKEFIQTILSADSVAPASTFSYGALSAKLTSMAASLTLNEPLLGFTVPDSPMKAADADFKVFGTATKTVTDGAFSRIPDISGFTSRAVTGSVKSSSATTSSAPDGSVLIYKNTFNDKSIAKFELTIKNANFLTVVKSRNFLIQDKSYELVVENLQGQFNVELKPWCSDLRTQPIMLVKLVSNKGADESISQHTRFRTKKLISWEELENPEYGFSCHDIIHIEVIIIKSSIDLEKTKRIMKKQFTRLMNTSVRRLCIEVPKNSILNGFYSADFLIHGVPWKISVSKETIDAKQSLAVYLFCNEDFRAKCFYAASFTVKLISFTHIEKTIEFQCEPYAFSSPGVGYGLSLIAWSDLLEYYLKNGRITLDIEIDFDNPKTTAQAVLTFEDISNSLEDDQRKFKIKIENVDSLVAVELLPFEMQNSQWDLQIYKYQNHLCVFLNPIKAIPVTMKVEMLSSNGENKSLIKYQNANALESIRMRTTVTTWSELLRPENGFVNNNSISLEVTISVDVEDVSDANKHASAEASSEIGADCPICFENMKEIGASNISCGHLFCTQCLTNALQLNSRCPFCRDQFKSSDIRRVFLP